MLTKRRMTILLLLLVFVAAGATYYYASSQAAAAGDEDAEPVQTATVRRGMIVVSATGAGTVIPAQEVKLAFTSNGRVSELPVEVGDRVVAGDLLARVDATAAHKALANAELQLVQARMQTEADATTVGISYDDISIAMAEMNLVEAEAALAELRNWRPDEEAIALAQAQLEAAQASSSVESPASAQINILSAEQKLAATQNGPDAETISAAEKAVARAELGMQQAYLNREAHALSLAQAELAVDAAEATLANTSLTAPIGGTVLAINAEVGESVSGAVVVLADLSKLVLEVFLDETDLDKVGPGYEVDIVFDGMPEETFTGQVVRVDPQLVKESGVSAVRAVVEVTYDKPQPLPVGLSATVDVIGGRAENALLVPVEAVREISPGQYSLFVMEDGQPQLRMVEVGLMDFTFAEITAGVEAGDVVTTGLVKTD